MDAKETLKQLLDSGMTQAQIGASVGLHQSTISDMVNHGIGLKNPSYDFVIRLGKLYKKRFPKTQVKTKPNEHV